MAQAVTSGNSGAKPATAVVAAKPKLDLKGMGLALAGGVVVLFVAVQLIPKPQEIKVAGAVKPSPGTGSSTAMPGMTGVGARPGDGTPSSGSGFQGIVPEPTERVAGVRNLFQPLVVVRTEPKPVPAANTPPPAPLPKPQAPVPTTPTAPVGPVTPPAPTGPQVSDLQMMGVVELGTDVKALIRKPATGESRYLAKGEEAFGFKVEEIKSDEVVLSHGGKSETLAMSTAVVLETSGGSSTSSSGSGGFGRSGFGSPGGFSGSRGDRGDRGDRGNRGGDRGGPAASGAPSGGFSTAQIMSLPTWAERLKKLEEIKAQLEPDRYTRLKSFMEARAKAEAGK